MKTRVAINGFGRIGRTVFKILMERDDVIVVAINDLTDNSTLAHLLKYDTNYGKYNKNVDSDENHISVDGREVEVLTEPDPAKLPWGEKNVDIVVESTGRFVRPEQANDHIKAGAKKVIITAPAKGEDANRATTIVLGVNDADLDKSSDVLSNASCTTNCVGPVAAVMHNEFGIAKAMMTTIHSYTADQNLQDGPHRDLRRARAAAQNIVPTTSGSAIATSKVLPDLEGKFDGMAMRVPTSIVSITDFTILIKKRTTVQEVNEVFKEAAEQPFYKGVIEVTEDPLVSSDLIGNSHSAIIDLSLTNVVDGDLVKVVAWYDNEWGFSNRLAELVVDTGKLLATQAQTEGD
jgi:glyceraldehyde 3-phosphate dehydrogenase